jgi:hypothetical protein
VRHHLVAAALLLALLAVPSTAAAAPVLKVPVPKAGDISVAHVAFKGKRKPLRIANRRLLGDGLTVVGGARKGLVSVVVVRRASGSAGDATVTVRLPKGRVKKRRVVANVVAKKSSRPPYCAALPASFAYAKLLAGDALPGFSAADTAKYASFIGCRTFPRQSAFVGAFDGGASSEGGGEGSGGGGPTGPNPEECRTANCEEEPPPPGPVTSSTLRGEGSVSKTDDPRRFTYSISFNEPVTGYTLSDVGLVYCPASVYASWYDSCPPEATHPPGTGMRCDQPPSSSVQDFTCDFPRNAEGEAPDTTVPAGTVITGTYITDQSQAPPDKATVGLVGYQKDVQSPKAQIPVS